MKNITPQQIHQETEAALAEARKLLRRILAPKKTRTVENTLKALNEISIVLSNAMNKFAVLENLHPNEKVREAAQAGTVALEALDTDLGLNRQLYDAIWAVDVSEADPTTRLWHSETIKDFRRGGVTKSETMRAKIKKLEDALTQLELDFDSNIRDGIRYVELDPAELKGMPEDYIANHPAGPNGKVRITTEYPDYTPFLDYAESAEARKQLFLEFMNRAYPQNEKVLAEMVAKRRELARILGFASWTDFITKNKMAKSSANVRNFLDEVVRAAITPAANDMALLELNQSPDADTVERWEWPYLAEKIKKHSCGFDSKELREYFAYDAVRDGIVELAETLFGLKFEKSDVEMWHESVESHNVFDAGKLIGRIHLDMHPREGKFSHAAQQDLVAGVKDVQIPEAVLMCNFPGGDGTPGLLSWDDFETFLHEFGHLMHTVLGGNQEWVDFSGCATEWDFVEAPSQMLEEWAYDYKVLRRFARHYQTGKSIPKELVDKMREANGMFRGIVARIKHCNSMISLELHDLCPNEKELAEIIQRLTDEHLPFAPTPGVNFHCNFGHLSDYSSIFYTYPWSHAIAKDLFTGFDHDDLLDPRPSMKYRRTVLEPGGSKPAAQLIEDFLGRPYNLDAYKKWLNEAI